MFSGKMISLTALNSRSRNPHQEQKDENVVFTGASSHDEHAGTLGFGGTDEVDIEIPPSEDEPC
jgi:hypothetical protein